MRRDHRLSCMLQVLIHIERHGAQMTSEMIADAGRQPGHDANPVMVRWTTAGSRVAAMSVRKGHGGGWGKCAWPPSRCLTCTRRSISRPTGHTPLHKYHVLDMICYTVTNSAMSGVTGAVQVTYGGARPAFGGVVATLGSAFIAVLPVGANAQDRAANNEPTASTDTRQDERSPVDLDTIVVTGQHIPEEYAGG